MEKQGSLPIGPGAGTLYSLVVPATVRSTAVEKPGASPSSGVPGRNGLRLFTRPALLPHPDQSQPSVKYQCIIVEDNAIERDLLELLLRRRSDVEITGVFEDGLQALHFLQQNPADIAFTDVDMPGLTGIELLKSLRRPPCFVFISAHSSYAADGYELDAVDFIRKPVSPDRLYRALGKALELLKQRGDTGGSDLLLVRTSEGIHKLRTETVVYAESSANYSLLQLHDGTSLMVLTSLKQLEEQMPPGTLFRVHKNYLINWHLVTLIRKDSVVLAGGQEVPIGDSRRKELADKLAGYASLGRRPGK